ncbi:NAD(P)H-binding protein, partial [candidate division FCPU426 bacterium]|nr:NAD(P)H-binding protein [candidate division FCPU426 bacterium]
MKVLVTGGSGFLGTFIVRELLSCHHEVRVLCLPQDPAPTLQQLPVEKTAGDVLTLASLQAACAGCEAVVHAAGSTNLD